jgi:hypothetical protein
LSGADWMLGKLEPKPQKKLARAAVPLNVDDAVRYLEDAAGDGKKLVTGIRKGVEALEALRTSGLTGEALVVLITEKCARAKNGSRLSADTVQLVLEGLFRLGEYTR